MALGRRIGLAAMVAMLGLALCGFRPFSPVQSVCPKCPVNGDKVKLKNGKVVIAKVIGKNQDGYILERYGELRFIQTRELSHPTKGIVYKSGAEPRGIGTFDQILLRDKQQTVLHGTLIKI